MNFLNNYLVSKLKALGSCWHLTAIFFALFAFTAQAQLDYCEPETNIDCGDYGLAYFSLTHDSGFVVYYGGCDGTVDGYLDMTDTVLELTAGETYSGTANSASPFAESVAIWIDLNQDGEFSVDERVGSAISINYGPVSFEITVPGTSMSGNTRMRVVENFGSTAPSNPCNLSWGMAIDYTVDMTPHPQACTGTPNAGDASISSSSGVTWSEVDFTATGYADAELGISYTWEYKYDDEEWSVLSSGIAYEDALDVQINGELGTVLYARLAVSCSASGETTYSNVVTFEIIAPNCSVDLGDYETITLPFEGTNLTTCGSGDVLNPFTAIPCGFASYLGGQDAIFVFTPDVSGIYQFELTTETIWTGMFLWEGCPLINGDGECVESVVGVEGNKPMTASLEAGATYYLVIDTYPITISSSPPP